MQPGVIDLHGEHLAEEALEALTEGHADPTLVRSQAAEDGGWSRDSSYDKFGSPSSSRGESE